METVLLVLFFPFVFYLLWGPVALFFTARVLMRRLCARHPPTAAGAQGIGILTALFLPVAVTSPGGNIAVVWPWWVAVLGWLLSRGVGGVEFSGGSFVPAFLFLPVVWWLTAREARRATAAR